MWSQSWKMNIWRFWSSRSTHNFPEFHLGNHQMTPGSGVNSWKRFLSSWIWWRALIDCSPGWPACPPLSHLPPPSSLGQPSTLNVLEYFLPSTQECVELKIISNNHTPRFEVNILAFTLMVSWRLLWTPQWVGALYKITILGINHLTIF